jgi:hypothetical protein
MLLALTFLPAALVVITIGLPVLILLASIGAMGFVIYSNICTLLSGGTQTRPSSFLFVSPASTPLYHSSVHHYYSGPRSPIPSSQRTGMKLPKYRTSSSSSSSSPLRFRAESGMETPPSPTSSIHDINVDERHRKYDSNSLSNRQHRVRFE